MVAAVTYKFWDPSRGEISFSAALAQALPATAPVLRYPLMPSDYMQDNGGAIAVGASAGNFGIARTAGTSMVMVGEATSASTKVDKLAVNTSIPNTYVAGAALPVVINAQVTGGGTFVPGSSSLALAAYTVINGVEVALSVSATQQLNAAQQDYTFSVTPPASLPIGTRIVLEPTMTVTSSAGASTGQINSVGIGM